MFDKSPERIAIEHRIDDSHDQAQKEAVTWCLKHPVQGAGAFAFMLIGKDVSDSVVTAWKSLPSWRAYQQAYKDLEAIEEKEGHLATHYYAQTLDRLAEHLPAKAREVGYYPFAGLDFIFARLFRTMVFQDVGYGKEYKKNMWWDAEAYGSEAMHGALARLRDLGIHSKNQPFGIEFLSANCNKNIRFRDNYNSGHCTLIIKGGHSVKDYLTRRYDKTDDPLRFGAAMIISPAEGQDAVRIEMDKRGYERVHSEPGEDFYAPHAMRLGSRAIFVRRD